MTGSVVRAVARNELYSPAFVLLATLSVLLFGGGAFAYPSIHAAAATTGPADVGGLIAVLEGPTTLVLAVTGLLFGYGRFHGAVRRRIAESPGILRPFLGAILTRVGVLWLALLVGWVSAGIAFVATYEPVPYSSLVPFLALVAIYGGCFVVLGVTLRLGPPSLVGLPVVLLAIGLVVTGSEPIWTALGTRPPELLALGSPPAVFSAAVRTVTGTALSAGPGAPRSIWIACLVLVGWSALAVGVGWGLIWLRRAHAASGTSRE